MTEQPRGRPPRGDEQRREQRLAVSREAVRLFRADGVSAVSGAQIAAAAGISERTLWRLFRTKEACVEPVLELIVDAGAAALRAWPADVPLDQHLVASSHDLPADDLDAAIAVIRMSHESRPLRAVWLLLQERNESVLAEVLAERAGGDARAPEVLARAAAINAVLRLLVDAATYDDESGDGVDRLLLALRRLAD